MPSRRFLWSTVLCVLFSAGCQCLQTYRPVSVQAVDAETHNPIPGATVRISYPLTPEYRSPADASGVTGDDGAVRLRAAAVQDGFAVDATTPGYMPEARSLSGDAVQGPAPAPVVLAMYATPGPTVELVVPVGYRGLVRVETHVRDDLPCPPGQRRFQYDVPSTGVVEITGPAIFRRVPAVRARYADGTALAGDAPDLDIGFRYVKSENGCDLYMVGTRMECDAYRREADAGGRPTSNGNKGQGGGRRGRRGGAPPSDANGS